MSTKSIHTEPSKSMNEMSEISEISNIDLQSADMQTLQTLARKIKDRLCSSITEITKLQQLIYDEEIKIFACQRMQKEILSILKQKTQLV